MKRRNWIREMSQLRLENYPIRIEDASHEASGAPLRLIVGQREGLPYWNLEAAKRDGESRAAEIDEFNPFIADGAAS